MEIMNNTENYDYNIESRKVDPTKYAEKIRLYCDIDGVILPFTYDKTPAPYAHDAVNIHYDFYRHDYETREIKHIVSDHTHLVNLENINKLVELSKRDDIDFVWLTSWRENALIIEEAFGFESLGYLPWDKRMGDYNQVFKNVAIQKDQKEYPSRFIWIDDIANSNMTSFTEKNKEKKYVEVLNEPGRYISVNTESSIGITLEEIDKIIKWI